VEDGQWSPEDEGEGLRIDPPLKPPARQGTVAAKPQRQLAVIRDQPGTGHGLVLPALELLREPQQQDASGQRRQIGVRDAATELARVGMPLRWWRTTRPIIATSRGVKPASPALSITYCEWAAEP